MLALSLMLVTVSLVRLGPRGKKKKKNPGKVALLRVTLRL